MEDEFPEITDEEWMRDPRILMRAAFRKQAVKIAEREKRHKKTTVRRRTRIPHVETGMASAVPPTHAVLHPQDVSPAPDTRTLNGEITNPPVNLDELLAPSPLFFNDRASTPESLRSSPDADETRSGTGTAKTSPPPTHVNPINGASMQPRYASVVVDPADTGSIQPRHSAAVTNPADAGSIRPRQASTATIHTPSVESLDRIEILDTSNSQPPEWYRRTKLPKRRGDYDTTIDNLFGAISRSIRNVIDTSLPSAIPTLADSIHKAFFISFKDDQTAKTAIRRNAMLDNNSGLPRIFTSKHPFPYWLVADAKELYTKWWHGIFDTGLYRGIIVGKVKNARLEREQQANKLDPSYSARRRGNYFGNGELLNGQWWPHQLCAVRDGAHNSAQAGITGAAGEGAWSIILAGDPKYPDIDNGHQIFYCGTEGSNGKPTDSTQRMLESVDLKQRIRVIRSEKCKNPMYRPAAGYRYDGLYPAVDKVLLDVEKAHYRFQLLRLPDQDPIRFYGPGVRPSAVELAAFKRAKEERKYLA